MNVAEATSLIREVEGYEEAELILPLPRADAERVVAMVFRTAEKRAAGTFAAMVDAPSEPGALAAAVVMCGGKLPGGRAVQRVHCDQPTCRHRLPASGLCSLPRVEMQSHFFDGCLQHVECASYEFDEDEPK